MYESFLARIYFEENLFLYGIILFAKIQQPKNP